MPRFQRKRTVITAELFDVDENPNPFGKVLEVAPGIYAIETPNGAVQLEDGDWIIDNTPTREGDYYPVKPQVFDSLYEPAVEEPAAS